MKDTYKDAQKIIFHFELCCSVVHNFAEISDGYRLHFERTYSLNARGTLYQG